MATITHRELEIVPGRRPPFLIHAEQEAVERSLYDFPIVDVDSHIADQWDLRQLVRYMRNPNIVRAFQKYEGLDMRRLYQGWNIGDRPIAARSKTYGMWEDLPEVIPEGLPRTAAAAMQFMDRTGIDYLVSFPTMVLTLGSLPQAEMQAEVVRAYNDWLVGEIIPCDRRILAMPCLPVTDPLESVRTVERLAGRRNVVGWMITAARHEPLHQNEYVRLWSLLNEIGKPVAFHSGPDWKERPFEVMGRFFGAHGLGFSFYSMLHLTNIVLSGLAERFPRIKWIFIESGQSWVPFVMARLDQQYRRRSSEAPLLKRLPSEYIREMYFTTQPFEEHSHDPAVGRAIFDLTNGANSWLYASDYPHHDFDVPGLIYGTTYLSEQERRAVLGENALKLFGLPHDLPTKARRQEALARG
jgi:predicted TIM-barrel fold metal-dependent hydrolase